jgi:Mn-dependent DtxR family transcriptional regulator
MNLCIPERVLDQHMIVLGKTGAGKSSALRHIVENRLRHHKRICIVDIKGDWWGLKSSADGSGPGFPIIAFGSFRNPKATDVPINSKSGKEIAQLITGGNRPCIIGLSGWMPHEVQEFWIDFASTLFRTNQGELILVVSECHNFSPKGKILSPEAGKVIHWTNRLLGEGRGIGLVFLGDSQRPQKVHNDTLDSCETLVAMRVNHPAARDAIKEWIDGNGDPAIGKEVLNTLAQLKRGEGWVWSPEIGFGPQRVTFPMFETFDSFAPPQLQRKVSESGWSTVDLEVVKQKLNAVIEEAKANDPKELKAQIVRLKAELVKAHTDHPPSAPVIDQSAINDAVERQRTADNQILGEIVRDDQRLRDGLMRIATTCRELVEIGCPVPVGGLQRIAPSPAAAMVSPPPKPQQPLQRQMHATSNGSGVLSELTRPQGRILEALAEAESIGRKQITRSWLAFIAGASPSSSAFVNNVSRLSSLGLIQYPQPGVVAFSPKGRELTPLASEPLTPEDMADRIRSLITRPQADLLYALIQNHPNAITREALANEAGVSPNSSAFVNNVSALSSREIVEYPERGKVKLQDWVVLQ